MTGRWVIDASVLAKVYLRDEEQSERARDLVTRFAEGSAELFAPQLVLYEVPSTILSAVRQRRLSEDRAEAAIRDFFGLAIPLVGDDATLPSMVRAAYSYAQDAGCKLYDAMYLVVAREMGVPFITADAKLLRTLSAWGDEVVWLGDYQPEA